MSSSLQATVDFVRIGQKDKIGPLQGLKSTCAAVAKLSIRVEAVFKEKALLIKLTLFRMICAAAKMVTLEIF